MSIEVLPFRIENIKNFEYDGVESHLSGKDVRDICTFYAALGESFIGLSDGKIIAVGGIFPMWGNVGTAWMFLNRDAQKHKLSLFKHIVVIMDALVEKYKIKTLSVSCIQESPEAERMIKHLGFNKTSEIKMFMYSRGEI